MLGAILTLAGIIAIIAILLGMGNPDKPYRGKRWWD